MPERSVITSLIGPAAPLVTVNADSMDSLNDGSMFLPRMWHKSTPFLLDDQQIGPNNPTAYNTDINFEIPKQATCLGECFMDAQYNQATITGAGQPIWVDWLGYAQIANFQMLFGSNKLYDTTSDDYYFRMRTTMNIETQQREALTNLGDTTTAQRNASLVNVNGTHLITDLMLPFACSPINMAESADKAYPLITLSQKTRFTLRLDLLANLLNVPAGVTVSVPPPTLKLLITTINTTADEGSAILAMSQQTNGITYMMHQRIRQTSDTIQITNATGGSPVTNLTSLTKPLKVLYWALVPSHLRDNTNRNNRFFFAPQPPAPVPLGMTPYQRTSSWSIESGGQIIQRTVDNLYNRIVQFGRRHPAPVGDEIFHQSYSMNPVCLNETHGFLDWTNLNNPRLTITFPGTTGIDVDTGAAQTLYLIVNALDYNWLYVKSGNITRAFN